MIGVDLHTHSNISDGRLSPEMLVDAALAKGIHTLALTDHDSMDGVARAQLAAQNQAIEIVPGVEISSQWSRPSTKKSYAVHIVALNMQAPEPLEQLLLEQKRVRAARAEEICQRLTTCIQKDIYADVLAKVEQMPERITRSHIAQTLLEQRVVKRLQQAFDLYLKQGKKAYVPFVGPSMAETIEIIHQSQGYAVLAHPTRYDLSATNIRFMLELFAQCAGDAAELPQRSEPAGTRQMMDRLIAQNQLKVSIGSDFHGEHMPWLPLGNVPAVKDDQVGIWQNF
ncbi:PHP domain-containing protein [Acinetobacter rudis]|uniref:PHP domain-containing protein n=1 Tax=Acinetobacter rudis TaxID=632955 RepID=UPI00334136C0